tara:strand:+ start:2199 stop:2852 length:654 start_codon:yes stop_codon:yes gene_type:complete
MDERKTGQDFASATDSGTSITQDDLNKAVSDALAAAGRDAKTIKDMREEADATLKRARETEDGAKEARRQSELAVVRDDPEALSAVRQRHQSEDYRQQGLRAQEDADNKLEEAKRLTQVSALKEAQAKASALSVETGVDADTLMNLSDGNPDKMEALAKVLPKGDTSTQSNQRAWHDSGRNIGGATITRESIANMSPKVYAANRAEIEKAYSDGRIK